MRPPPIHDRLAPLLLGALVLTSCSKPSASAGTAPRDPGADAAFDAESLGVLRESARELLDANCGECHTGVLPTALPRALADLTDLDWSRRMSDEQLRDADRRVRAPVAPTLGEAELRPIHATDAELARFRRYVQLEMARRAAGRAR